MKTGFIYIAHGETFINELKVSAESLKKFCPNIPITLFSDMKPDCSFIDKTIIIEPKSIRTKVYYINRSPYERTCFLDTDVVLNHDISDIFSILDKFEMAGVHDLARKREKYDQVMPKYAKIPYSFPEINTGVLSFKKCDNVDKLFTLWAKYHKQYYDVCPYDQPSFRISLWKSNTSFCALPIEYNVRSKQNRKKQDTFHHEFGDDHLKTRIFHMHHGKTSFDDAIAHCKNEFQEY
jgi:hypothetical protein